MKTRQCDGGSELECSMDLGGKEFEERSKNAFVVVLAYFLDFVLRNESLLGLHLQRPTFLC
jgi:hypothetical protein